MARTLYADFEEINSTSKKCKLSSVGAQGSYHWVSHKVLDKALFSVAGIGGINDSGLMAQLSAVYAIMHNVNVGDSGHSAQ